jgi:serine/threonine protein kinase
MVPSILNIDAFQAARLLEQFNTGDLEFFQYYFDALPTANLVSSAEKDNSVDITLFIEGESVGEGGYGTIFKNRSRSYVYKIVDDYKRIDGKNSLVYLKTNFKEAIVQGILQSDPLYGKHVCKLYKVYRAGPNFVFQMEPLEIDLGKYKYANRLEEGIYKTMGRVLLKSIEILDYFYKKYGFQHNDAGPSNIMTVKKGDVIENIKLIDFGKSVVKFDDIQIGSDTKRKDTIVLYKNLKYDVDPISEKLAAKLVRLKAKGGTKKRRLRIL